MDANSAQTGLKTAKKTRKPKYQVIPGAYICNQKLDEVLMYNAEILHSVEAVTGIAAPKEEIYRMIARICDQAHKSDKVLSELKLIYK